MTQDARPVLVTGATGYVGSRLVPRLLAKGVPVRAMGRSLAKLRSRPWSGHPHVELVAADVLDAPALARAAAGCRAAYYLVHAMGDRGDFAAKDRTAAANMVAAAEAAGLEHIIYLGGLGDEADLSEHLRSRAEVGRVLRGGRVPVTTLRAAVILGSGSASFEILRYLVDRLPIMITPRWVSTRSQPIAVRNVLEYLVGVLDLPAARGETLDIGGPEILTYRSLMEIYASEAGLPRRIVIPVPVLTPRLSSYWIHLVTPAPASLARPLAEGLRNEVVVKDDRILKMIPQRLLSAREAIQLALARDRDGTLESHWTDAGALPSSARADDGDPLWTGGTVLVDERRMVLDASPDALWDSLVRIGGATGWYYADWLWRTRGRIDKLVGGVGVRRGRRDKTALREGDVLDFWRVVAVEPASRLLLAAEMRLPGEAELEFQLTLTGHGTELRQTARFRPRGLGGLLYWYGIYPLHALVFRGMLHGIAEAAASPAARIHGWASSRAPRESR